MLLELLEAPHRARGTFPNTGARRGSVADFTDHAPDCLAGNTRSSRMGRRLEGIPGFGIDRVAEAAGSDPEVLRLENYDTDIPPHPDAVEATRAAIGRDEANSYLPFSGLDEMKEAVAELIARRGGPRYDPYGEIVITDGDGSAVLNGLFVLTDPGDEVILTDPTYAGMLQRVRLVGAVPRLVPLRGDAFGWRLDLEALQAGCRIAPACSS